MQDLISRQAAIGELERRFDGIQRLNWEENPNAPFIQAGILWSINTIRDLPPAQSEIIRCKDCKHYLRPHGCGHIDGMVTAQEDGFCSYAERRTDE